MNKLFELRPISDPPKEDDEYLVKQANGMWDMFQFHTSERRWFNRGGNYHDLNDLVEYLAPFDIEQYAWQWIQKLNEKDIEIIELKKRLAEPVEGMRWVKASERVPIGGTPVIIRFRGRNHAAIFWTYTTEEDNVFDAFGTGLLGVNRFSEIEWFDISSESPTPSAREAELEREVERLKGLIEKAFDAGSNTDAAEDMTGHYWKQFKQQHNL